MFQDFGASIGIGIDIALRSRGTAAEPAPGGDTLTMENDDPLTDEAGDTLTTE